MAQESQTRRPGLYQTDDKEIALPVFKSIHKEERSNKCFVYIFATFVILFALALGFASIVLRVTSPQIELRSATVNHIKYITSPSPSFNVTMIAYLTIKNPNFGRFNYDNSTVSVQYEGASVGDGGFGSARLKARETKGMNLTVNMRSTKLLVTGNLTSDINSGMLNLTSYAKLSGKVHLFKIFQKTTTAEMACIMNLNLTSKSIQDFQC
ncbi:hypothetical protein L6164_028281 [Bauhinia variegata]|uniref:Uncharacterized protein n=1 Tax=Bauhinia variegata TaxID=167791 RepID=A0ACB9LVQ1_BAUVA|nr:hypothetical protein L6164_028281 [Bauhinia variegata]